MGPIQIFAHTRTAKLLRDVQKNGATYKYESSYNSFNIFRMIPFEISKPVVHVAIFMVFPTKLKHGHAVNNKVQ